MEIKNCPHCGGTANIWKKYDPIEDGVVTVVVCDICGAQGKPATAENDIKASKIAVFGWNMRAPKLP